MDKLWPLATTALLMLLLAPPASASHAACGAPDGYVFTPDLAVWLHPGCLGVGVSDPIFACGFLVHMDVGPLTVIVFRECYVAGVWLA